MLGLRHLPLKYRLPLIHGVLWGLAGFRARDWARARDDDTLKPGPFIVSGLLNESLGIGQAGRLTLRALREAGYEAVGHDLRPAFRRLLHQDAVRPDGDGGVWLIHANPSEALVALLAHPPAGWANAYRIGYWAWETSKAPASWVFVADYFHEIWVPSDFVRDAIALTFTAAKRDDLIGRLRVMPHPVPVVANGSDKKRQQTRLRHGLGDGCEVLCLFDAKSSATRKNPWGVIDAWENAFPVAAKAARLTIKIADGDRDAAGTARLRDRIAGRTDMRIVADNFSEADMHAFIGAFDILVSLHRAEGFGLTLAEAMAEGVAAVATGWSGNLQFMTPDNAKLIPYGLVPVSDPEGPYLGLDRDPDQLWAEPRILAASLALRDLAASPDLRRQLAQAGRAAIPGLSATWSRDALVALAFNRWL